MNSSFVGISILVKSRISEKFLINILMNMSSHSLRSYLKLANVYDGNSNKKKTNLIEILVYGCITNKLSNELVKDISLNKAMSIFKRKRYIS